MGYSIEEIRKFAVVVAEKCKGNRKFDGFFTKKYQHEEKFGFLGLRKRKVMKEKKIFNFWEIESLLYCDHQPNKDGNEIEEKNIYALTDDGRLIIITETFTLNVERKSNWTDKRYKEMEDYEIAKLNHKLIRKDYSEFHAYSLDGDLISTSENEGVYERIKGLLL